MAEFSAAHTISRRVGHNCHPRGLDHGFEYANKLNASYGRFGVENICMYLLNTVYLEFNYYDGRTTHTSNILLFVSLAPFSRSNRWPIWNSSRPNSSIRSTPDLLDLRFGSGSTSSLQIK